MLKSCGNALEQKDLGKGSLKLPIQTRPFPVPFVFLQVLGSSFLDPFPTSFEIPYMIP